MKEQVLGTDTTSFAEDAFGATQLTIRQRVVVNRIPVTSKADSGVIVAPN
jgi:hypothetical protein